MKLRIEPMLLLLAHVISVGDAMASEPREQAISTPSGTVTTTTETVDPVPQEIQLVDAGTIAEFASMARDAKGFLSVYLTEEAEPTLEALDKAFQLWQSDGSSAYSAEEVVGIYGAYLGSRLVADFDMEWVVVTDEYGTDYAVRAKKCEVLAFPFSSIAKRVERGQFEFMVGVYYATKHTIDSGECRSR